jgi:hypothetical protein
MAVVTVSLLLCIIVLSVSCNWYKYSEFTGDRENRQENVTLWIVRCFFFKLFILLFPVLLCLFETRCRSFSTSCAVLAYLPECKTTLIWDNPSNNTCQEKMYMSKSRWPINNKMSAKKNILLLIACDIYTKHVRLYPPVPIRSLSPS